MEINVDSVHFQHFSLFFSSFSWKIIHLKKFNVCTFCGGVGLKKCMLYTHLNVDNYGQPLSNIPIICILTVCAFSY